MYKTSRLFFFIFLSIFAFSVSAPLVFAADGSGTMSVTPSSVVASTSDMTLLFDFNNTGASTFSVGSLIELTIPAGWTAPQTTDALVAGYVTAINGANAGGRACDPGTIIIEGDGPWTVIIPQICARESHLTISYSAVTAPAAGTYIFDTKSQHGDSGLTALTNGSPSVTVTLADQTIDFIQLSDAVYGDAPMNLVATASSSLLVLFESETTDVCTVEDDAMIQIVSVGICTIRASQEGDDTYAAAPTVDQSFVVHKKSLTVTADDQTKLSGASDASLTYTVTVDDLVNGDTESVVSGALVRDAGEKVGTTTIARGTVTAGEKYEVVFSPGIFTITIDPTASSTVLSVSGESEKSGTVPAETVASTTSNGIQMTVIIPSGTVITGPSGWDGILTLPIATTTYTLTASSGNTASLVEAIEVGAGDLALTFDRAVKLTFVGQAGKLIGWSQIGTFHSISAICDSSTSPTLAAGADCKIDVGSDLVVWTRHFSTFIAYTETVTPPTVSPTVASGGGGGGGRRVSTTAIVTPTVPLATTTPVIEQSDVNTQSVNAENQQSVEAMPVGAAAAPTVSLADTSPSTEPTVTTEDKKVPQVAAALSALDTATTGEVNTIPVVPLAAVTLIAILGGGVWLWRREL